MSNNLNAIIEQQQTLVKTLSDLNEEHQAELDKLQGIIDKRNNEITELKQQIKEMYETLCSAKKRISTTQNILSKTDIEKTDINNTKRMLELVRSTIANTLVEYYNK